MTTACWIVLGAAGGFAGATIALTIGFAAAKIADALCGRPIRKDRRCSF